MFLSLNIVIVSKNLKKLTNNVSLSNEKIYKHSWCVHVRWNPLEHNPSRPVETRRNPFRLTRLNPSKHVTIRSDLLEHVSSRPNEFSILYFYIFYFIHPPLLLLLHPPHPPNFPIFFFVFLGRGGGGGGEGAGDGDGTGGEPPPPPAGRSPLRRGGDKVPPPSPSNKKTKFTNQTTYVL